MTKPLILTGKLSEKDQRKLLKAVQGDSIGPTTLYYAGVTAPVIGAGMAVLGRTTLVDAGLSQEYWLALFSAIFAAVAGVVWYLIFVRWSIREIDRLGTHENYTKEIILEESHLTLKRQKVETRIELTDIRDISDKNEAIMIRFESAAPIYIPSSWFQDDGALRETFINRLKVVTA